MIINKHINPNDMGFNFKEVNELKATFDTEARHSDN